MAARKPCTVSGCPELATKGTARCADHALPPKASTWDTSSRTKPKGWRRRRERVLKRDGHTCVMCGAPASVVDHLVPQAWGGSEEEHNLRAMCRLDHARKTSEEAHLSRLMAKTADPREKVELMKSFTTRWKAPR